MNKTRTALALLLSFGLACAPEPESRSFDDAFGGGKADDPVTEFPHALARATADQVAAHFAEHMSARLAACFQDYRDLHNPTAVLVTANVIEKLQSNSPGCWDVVDLKTTLQDVLEHQDRAQAEPAEFDAWFLAWATDALQPAVVDEVVGDANLDARFAPHLEAVREESLLSQESDPWGISLVGLREDWAQVLPLADLERDTYSTTLVDPELLGSLTFIDHLREAFPLEGLELSGTGFPAIERFWNAEDGPAGDASFGAISTDLSKDSILKRYYFSTSSEDGSRSVLIVVDEHLQAYGFMMGSAQ